MFNTDESLSLQTDQAMQTMSLIYSELFSLLYVNPETTRDSSLSQIAGRKRKQASRSTTSSKKQRSAAGSLSASKAGAVQKQARHVRSYVTRTLRGETSSVSQPMGQLLSSSTYEALLPTLWWLLNDDDADEDSENDGGRIILRVVIEHAIHLGSSSGLKKIANELVMRLVLVRVVVTFHRDNSY